MPPLSACSLNSAGRRLAPSGDTAAAQPGSTVKPVSTAFLCQTLASLPEEALAWEWVLTWQHQRFRSAFPPMSRELKDSRAHLDLVSPIELGISWADSVLLGTRRWPGSWRTASTSTQSRDSPSMAEVPRSGTAWPAGSSSTRSTPLTCAGSFRCPGSSKYRALVCPGFSGGPQPVSMTPVLLKGGEEWWWHLTLSTRHSCF